MPDDGLNIGNTIEHMPIGLMERYCPLAKFEYTGSATVTLRKISYATFDRLLLLPTRSALRRWRRCWCS